MKFTNVKQLIIKFMGGGLINFPTRFLRWVKINGDTDDDGGGDASGGGSQEELDFINQAVNIIKNSTVNTFMTINAYNNIKDEVPPGTQKIGDENNADYVFAIYEPNSIVLFLTEDEFNIVLNMTIASIKSYLKGCIELNNVDNYNYNDESSRNYLNFDFVFLLVNDYEGTLVLDDIDVTSVGSLDVDNNGYYTIYVPYTQANNNFLFKIDENTNLTRFTKNVYIDTEHPVEVNGVNYYPIVYGEDSGGGGHQ